MADSDWSLLTRTAEGDDDAFRVLVERHQDRLLRLCERLLGDREEALDATQEVLIKAYDKAATLQPRGELFTWLYRVAIHHCLNKMRRRRIARFLPLADGRDEATPAFEPTDSAPRPDKRLESRERWAATRRAIDNLPESQRVVLVLAKFEGLSYRQIAATLGISEGAVESRLFRAMRNLVKAQESTFSGVSHSEA